MTSFTFKKEDLYVPETSRTLQVYLPRMGANLVTRWVANLLTIWSSSGDPFSRLDLLEAMFIDPIANNSVGKWIILKIDKYCFVIKVIKSCIVIYK